MIAEGLNYSTTEADGRREVGVNNNDGTFTVTRYAADGTVVSVDTTSGLPIEPPYPPLDPTGALATLLVVLNVVPLADASAAVREEPQHLIHEAEAWSLAP